MPFSAKKFFDDHLLVVLACICTLIVYFSFLFFGHISWDDPEMVFKNQAVKNFDVKAVFSNQYVGNYIPITMLIHAKSWFLFENNDAGHHLINILFHILNGILVYLLGQKLFKNVLIANIGALIFLLHPLQVESVGWISELKNVLSTSFYLLSLIFYFKFKSDKKTKWYIFAFLVFIIGCLSKSSVVVLPLTLLCIDLFVDGKITSSQILNKIPFLLISLIVGYINIQTQTSAQFINHAHEFPIYQRIGFAGFAILKYFILFLVPVKLSVIYPYPESKIPVFLTGFMTLIVLFFLIWFLFKKKQLSWLAVLLFVLVNLLLVLQFLPFGEVLYADRYLYVPMIGLAWMIGTFINGIKMPPRIIGIVLLFLFSVLSYSRVKVWKSAINLYEDIIKKYPDQFVALNSAGVESMFLNEDAKALEYFDRAVTVAPRNYKGFYNRGLLYLKNGRPQQAIESFNQTLALYDYGKAYTGRASAYYLLNDIPKAINDANVALGIDETNSKAHFVLGNCYNDLNKLDEANAEYNKAIRYNNLEPDYYFKRAILYGKKQDFSACLGDLEVCLALNPEYYEAYYWRGVAKVNLKQDPCPDLHVAARHNFEPAVIAYNKYCR